MSSENSIKSEKTPSESHAEVIVRMFPSDANPAGNVFGGEILKNIDMVAGIVAQRHSQSNAVTVSLDSVNFLKIAAEERLGKSFLSLPWRENRLPGNCLIDITDLTYSVILPLKI